MDAFGVSAFSWTTYVDSNWSGEIAFGILILCTKTLYSSVDGKVHSDTVGLETLQACCHRLDVRSCLTVA